MKKIKNTKENKKKTFLQHHFLSGLLPWQMFSFLFILTKLILAWHKARLMERQDMNRKISITQSPMWGGPA